MADLAFLLAELDRRLANMIKVGTVVKVDHGKALASVEIRTAGGTITTRPIPIPAGRAGDVKRWSPVSVGEQVMVASLGGETGAAFILGPYYQASQPAPGNNGTTEIVTFPDGTMIKHDWGAGQMSIKTPADLTIEAANVTVKTGKIRFEYDAFEMVES